MTPSLEDENQVRRYLLGEMPDRERTDFEDRCFTDDSFYQAVLAAEDDLIDSYVRGELAPAAKVRFEARYLASPRLSSRVDFARALHQRTGGQNQASFSIRARRWRPTPSVWLAAAAALIVMAGVSWWVANRNTSAPSIAQQQPQPGRTEESKMKPGAAASYVAFVLTPGTERAAARQPRLVVPQTAEEVRLEVRLEVTGLRDYEVVLQTIEGKQVWRMSGVAAQKGTLNLTVPAKLFQTADYILTASGTKPGGTREIAGEYSLSVRKHP